MTPKVLEQLHERALRDRDLASSRRARALAAHRDAIATLKSLDGYRHEHRVNGIAAVTGKPVPGGRLDLQHRFDQKLGEAIGSQSDRCEQLARTVALLDAELATAQRRVHAIDTLRRLRARDAVRRRDRVEQRITDEHAARRKALSNGGTR